MKKTDINKKLIESIQNMGFDVIENVEGGYNCISNEKYPFFINTNDEDIIFSERRIINEKTIEFNSKIKKSDVTKSLKTSKCGCDDIINEILEQLELEFGHYNKTIEYKKKTGKKIIGGIEFHPYRNGYYRIYGNLEWEEFDTKKYPNFETLKEKILTEHPLWDDVKIVYTDAPTIGVFY